MSRPLPAPSPRLRACVVVPARDEQALVGDCVRALAAQEGVDHDEYEVLLVLDRCTDKTEAAARAAAAETPGLALHVLAAGGAGVGHARGDGMDLAHERLIAAGRGQDGLIASTDADSVPDPRWLRAQLDAVQDGHRAIGGRIDLGRAEREELPPAVAAQREREGRDRWDRVRAEQRPGDHTEHWQFSGASLGVTAATYARVGRLEPRQALEDEGYERVLRRHGIPIARLAAVRVTTSGRRESRAPRGLATDLRRSWWLAERSFDGDAYTVDALLEAKAGRSVSLVLPAREVAATIGQVVAAIVPLQRAGLVDEVLVVDAASQDGTAQVARAAGARVEDENDLLADYGPCLGKGDAMWRGLAATSGEIVAFADTDTRDFSTRFVLGLLGPLLAERGVDFVKGAFHRPFDGGGAVVPDGGGRVTELLARPFLNLHVPSLAAFRQPLAGEIGARREILEAIAFPVGYGVEIAMLIDVERRIGLERMAQSDLGTRQNRHQSLRELSAMALGVLAAAERRVHGEEALHAAAPGPLLVPDGAGFRVRSVETDERPPLGTVRAAA